MRIRRSSLLAFMLLNATCLWAVETDRVIGSIGDYELHESEVLAALGSSGTKDGAALNQLVRAMLVQHVILEEALAQKWDVEPSIQPLLKNTRDAAIADSYLKSQCKPPESFPSESELKAAYEANRAALTVPRSFRLAQIFISKEPQAVMKRLKADPATFGQIARELSEEKQSASRDGEIGWLTEAQIQPEILAQLPKLALNVLSEPVKLKDGWHILKVLDVREPFTPIFDQVRAELVQRLRAEKTRANMEAYMSKTLQKHPVALNEVALSKLLSASKP